MSRLTCKDTLLDRISKPGMIGALGKVGTPSMQSLASRWRNGRGAPSLRIVEQLAVLVRDAEQYLATAKKQAAMLDERRKSLRKALWALPHGASKGPGITLKQVAAAAGLDRQLLTNFRCSDRPMGHEKVDRLQRAMKQLKLI